MHIIIISGTRCPPHDILAVLGGGGGVEHQIVINCMHLLSPKRHRNTTISKDNYPRMGVKDVLINRSHNLKSCFDILVN